LVRGWSHHWTLEPSLDSWPGAGAITELWSHHWTLGQGLLGQGLEPSLNSGAITGLLVRGWSHHWTLGQGLEPSLDPTHITPAT